MRRCSIWVLGLLIAWAPLSRGADHSWKGGDSTWGDTTATGWDGPVPGPGEIARIYGGTVACDHKDQLKGRYVYVGKGGKLVCGEMNYMGQPALLTFEDGGTLSIERTGHFNNYGALLLPADTWVTGQGAAPALIAASGSPEDCFVNMPGTATFHVHGKALTVAARLADQTDTGMGTAWVPAALVKDGPGALVLTGANTYSGPTTVKAGSLLVKGSVGAGAVQVAAGSTLGGDGTISGALKSSGIVAPGGGVGKLTVQADYTQEGAGALAIEIAGPVAGSQHDVLAVSGSAVLGGTLSVSLVGGYQPAVGQTFEFLTAGRIEGSFAARNLPPLTAGRAWDIRVNPNSVAIAVVTAGAP